MKNLFKLGAIAVFAAWIISAAINARLDGALLPTGQKAPTFALPKPGGGQLLSNDAVQGRKAVLVNFWFYS